jgi:hypothetical protein
MTAFPGAPIPPARYFLEYLPGAFAEAGLPPGSEGLDVKLGVALTGGGGGEWVFHVAKGRVAVAEASREGTAFSVRMSVDDFRGALWEGRGGAIARQAMSIFRPGERAAPAGPGSLAPPSPAALALLGGLDGMIRVIVAGGAGGDWQVDFKLGPGPFPEAPTTSVSVPAEDADQIERGVLNPLDAFMAGRIQIEGDLVLLMQLQAAQMQAQTGTPGTGSPRA